MKKIKLIMIAFISLFWFNAHAQDPDCPYITEVTLEDEADDFSFENYSGASIANYSDYTHLCIPLTGDFSQQIGLKSSQENVYMGIFIDEDLDGIYERTLSNALMVEGVLNMSPDWITDPVALESNIRFIVSSDKIIDPALIPDCGEVEDYLICEERDCPFISEIDLQEPDDMGYLYSNSSEYSEGNYADYSSLCIPFSSGVGERFSMLSSRTNVYMGMFLDIDLDGIYEVTVYNLFNATGAMEVVPGSIPFGTPVRFIVSSMAITDPALVPECGEVEVYVICEDCACDLTDLVLDEIRLVPTVDCELFRIFVDPVTGCLDVKESQNYNYKVYNEDGLLVYETNSTLNATTYWFLGEGNYTFVVRYTITDTGGCIQTVETVLEYYFPGCLCDALLPPANLSCREDIKDPTQNLSWDPVVGAVSYEIEYISNDPTCCGGTDYNFPTTVAVTSTSKTFDNSCFSWKVRAICADGSTSPWSVVECSCAPIKHDEGDGPGHGLKSRLDQDGSISNASLNIKVTTVPNPAHGFVTITLLDPSRSAELQAPEFVIYDMSGREVYRTGIVLGEAKRIDVSQFKNGIYIYKVIDQALVLSTEKLIIE
ncbi:MAG: hypothetical protein ACI8ZM_003843 [Crocinitomix sp.]|jgi:hypothetical protein